MNSYRPNYGSAYDYPPLPGAMQPPLPRGPPPTYDQYRGGDSYRPPQADFSFRSNDLPRFPEEYVQENGRPRPRDNHSDNKNFNRVRRGRPYKPRAAYRNAPADRPLLHHHDQTESTEQMLGMANGQKFMAAEDVSDSEEEDMDESDSDAEQGNCEAVDIDTMPTVIADGQAVEESLEPASKRRALTSVSRISKDGASEPKWSNPDPYTVLPPLDEQRKRRDVVKLIRKSRREAEASATELNQVAANDDFISFEVEYDQVSATSSPSLDGHDNLGDGMAGAPSAPRSFSHLQNLHGQQPQTTPNQASSAPKAPKEIVLDIPPNQTNSHAKYPFNGDEALGNRKRTRDDNIKGQKNGASHINGSILRDWVPHPSINPTPWLTETDTLTVNAGFRLHKEICDFYDFVKPQRFEHVIRQELLSRLQSIVTAEIPHASVLCFGSFAAGMYLPNADMDVVVVSNSFQTTGHKVICQTNNQLRRFADFVRSSKLGTDIETIAHARVPLVKFVDRLTGIRVDVSFENDTGIVANDTFASWKKQYPAMPVLVTLIKQFLMMRGLNEVVHGGIGGFSVTCLVTSLLQNMPRVQTGELVPEENLGELLIEFLDFYGNQLDTTRTGITMHPPGYFEKQNFRRPNKPGRGIYQADKTDRLAIMDPNKVENDISGGSRLTMLIFERFSQAHLQILRAMRNPGRTSLLDWSLGGDYESFTFQRNHLQKLYGDRQDPLGAIPDQYRVQEISVRGANGPLDEPRAFVTDPYNSIAKPKALTNKKVRRKKHIAERRAERAAEMKARFPDVKGIPEQLSLSQRTKLIAEHTARPATVQANTARALALKRQYPELKNIPNAVNKKRQKKLVDAYLAKKGPQQTVHQQAAPRVPPSERKSVRQAHKPQQPALSTGQGEQKNHPIPQKPQFLDNPARSASNKMAPLSNERRAEVARNLEGTSNDDPIYID